MGVPWNIIKYKGLIFGDNASVAFLHFAYSKNGFLRILQTFLLKKLESLQTEYSFAGLRRSHRLISEADEEG